MNANWKDQFIQDMYTIGLLADTCLGCGKLNCDSCPCGTGTHVVRDQLSPEAAEKLNALFQERRLEK